MSDDVRHDAFDELLSSQNEQGGGSGEGGNAFTVAFRGYERREVDDAIGELTARVQRYQNELAATEQSRRDSLDEMRAQQQAEIEKLVSDNAAALDKLRSEQQEAHAQLEADLAAATAQLGEAETKVTALTAELAGTPVEEGVANDREQFEAVLRVAEEQASLLIRNAASQAERLLEAAREQAEGVRSEAKNDAATIVEKAQHDSDQNRLRIDTEYTAHEARLEREAAHATEKVLQAEREAEAIRSEAEKGAAALRAMVTRETTDMRTEAEAAVREMNARVLEFEETLTRRQDDAQQEFLVLHNQAVSHAERITSDANAQVAASLEHAQRISNKAEDYERLMRAQAQQIDADARVKAQQTIDRAREKAQKIVDTVTGHSNDVLRDAEDRARQLRWQQQQMTSFMAEVRELIRPEGRKVADPAPSGDSGDAEASRSVERSGTVEVSEASDEPADDDPAAGDEGPGSGESKTKGAASGASR